MKKVIICLCVLVLAFLIGFFVNKFIHLYQVNIRLNDIKLQLDQLNTEVQNLNEKCEILNELDVEEGALLYEFGTN